MNQTSHYYEFDSSRIRPGDILLSASKSLVGAGIRAVTRSEFSHAAISLRPGLFVEAVSSGVRRIALGAFVIRRRESVGLYRLGDHVNRASSIAARAGNIAEDYLSREYWLPGALASVVKRVKPEHKTSFFCSHLVVTVYREAGIELLSEIQPENVCPGDITRSDSLEEITDQVLIARDAQSSVMGRRFLEDGQEPSLNDEENGILQAIYKRIADEYKRQGIEAPGDYAHVLRDLAEMKDQDAAALIDTTLLRALDDEGYLLWPSRVRAEMSLTLKTFDNLVVLLSEGGMESAAIASALSLHRQQALTSAETLKQTERELHYYQQQFRNTGLRTFEALAEMWERVVELRKEVHEVNLRCIELLTSGEPAS